ncbi:hypothetical protein LTS08_000811 [Lithohypha guttulata]|uniref:Sucrose transporter n=1 Tax=Lithohypha guttulata TaxID=1690604 RepID=A0AAN7T4X9_9EURO|nr:hypothetical protein LTR05_003009 [Lithohypha guttulata]KAK5106690.1 hypothetical protein LTS08_000811 [Lithohypha guttulata]
MAPKQTRISERSPLIIPNRSGHDDDVESTRLSSSPTRSRSSYDKYFEESKSTLYLILLTLSIGGLQIVWSIELSNGSPYLLSLGMSKALVAFVWLAGPMTGVLVQPYIGMISDRCQISWGKRKPFMLAGTAGVVGTSLLLAYARQIVFLIGRFNADAVYEGNWKGFTIALATVMMWCLDFSINTVQASIRAFIVDGAPAHQQEAANAWASRIVGIGNVFGYIAGYLDLPRHFWFLGKEQFQVLVAFASIVLTTLVLISVLTVRERNPQDEPDMGDDENLGFITFFKTVLTSIRRLPTPIYTVCQIQFFSWMGWFPFLFYITTYIGQLYVNPRLEPGLPDEDVNNLWGQATRVGTFALLIEAVVSLSANVLLPFLVEPTYKPKDNVPTTPLTPASPFTTKPRPQMRRSASSFNADMGLHHELNQSRPKTAPKGLHGALERLRIPGFTLRRAWFMSQILFALCMFSTFFINTPLLATIMVAVVGLSWSLSLWAPFALISAEISRREEERRTRQRKRLINGDTDAFFDDKDEEEDRAGIILGLHNVAVSAPQVIATLVCSIIFKFLQKPRNVPGDTSVAWALRLSGVAALGAAYFTWKMRESVSEDDDDE